MRESYWTFISSAKSSFAALATDTLGIDTLIFSLESVPISKIGIPDDTPPIFFHISWEKISAHSFWLLKIMTINLASKAKLEKTY